LLHWLAPFDSSMAFCASFVVRRSLYLAASQQLQEEIRTAKQEIRTDPDDWKRWSFEVYRAHWQSKYSFEDIEAYWLKCCFRSGPETFFGSCCADPRSMELFGDWGDEDAGRDCEEEDAEEDWENEVDEEALVKDEDSEELESAQPISASTKIVEDGEHVEIVVLEAACEYSGVEQTSESGKDLGLLAEDAAIDVEVLPSGIKIADKLSCNDLLAVPSPMRTRTRLGF